MNADTQKNVERTKSSDLARLMAMDDPGWLEADLSAMLRHQMEGILVFDPARNTVSETSDLPSPGQVRLNPGDLLKQGDPSEQLLRMMKDFFKARRDEAQNGPTEIATVLYYAAIVSARIRRKARISQLDDESLRKGINWALERAWLGEQLRGLFEERAGFQRHEIGNSRRFIGSRLAATRSGARPRSAARRG